MMAWAAWAGRPQRDEVDRSDAAYERVAPAVTSGPPAAGGARPPRPRLGGFPPGDPQGPPRRGAPAPRRRPGPQHRDRRTPVPPTGHQIDRAHRAHWADEQG